MGLISTKGISTWNTSNRARYEKSGYEFTDYGDTFETEFKDLSKGSHAKIKIQCDFCNTIYDSEYHNYYNLRSEKYCCPECLKHKKKTRNENGDLVFIEIPYRNKEWLHNEYIVKGRTAPEIAKECGINTRTLREWISMFDLCNKDGEKTKDITKEILEELYSNQYLTTEEIGLKFNVSENTILRLLYDFDIYVPTRSELLLRYYSEKGGREKARKIYGSMESRIKASCRQRGISIDEFDGFVKSDNDLLRTSCYYDDWRKSVFKRDNYTCQCCEKRGGNLHAHHKYNFSTYEDLRYDVDNGITFCEKCHAIKYPNSFHAIYGERNNTPEQVDEFIKMKSTNKMAV